MRLQRMNGGQSVDPAHSVGCAAVVVMVTPNKVICANAGAEKEYEKHETHKGWFQHTFGIHP